MVKTTVSLIKADIGSVAGHSIVAQPLFEIAKRRLRRPRSQA